MIREKRQKWQREKVQAAIKEEEKKVRMLAAAKAIEMNKKMTKSLIKEAQEKAIKEYLEKARKRRIERREERKRRLKILNEECSIRRSQEMIDRKFTETVANQAMWIYNLQNLDYILNVRKEQGMEGFLRTLILDARF